MFKDYDLVIIGNTREAIYAALKAVYLKARVALVKNPSQSITDDAEAIFNLSFSHITHLKKHWQEFGMPESPSLLWEQVTPWGQNVNDYQSAYWADGILLSLGVDVICGQGFFELKPELAFHIGNRRLLAQNYLLATGCSQPRVKLTELTQVGYLSAKEIWQQAKLAYLPTHLAIIGGTPQGLQLAQNLSRLGKEIILVVEEPRLLPWEEPETVRLLQAQLEAEGIEIYVDAPYRQIKQIEQKKWLQVGTWAIETDEIILATSAQPFIEGLSLESVGVKFDDYGIKVNQKLQTTNPRIYACGGLLGGYNFSHLGEYEAEIAVKNALFFPWFKVDYRSLPYVIHTNPPLARVGMTEAQAREYYGSEVKIIRYPFKNITWGQLISETNGLLKLIYRGSEILGAHIIGVSAGELITSLALMIQENIQLEKLLTLFTPSLTASELIHHSVVSWQHQALGENKNLQTWLENVLLWRRCWFK